MSKELTLSNLVDGVKKIKEEEFKHNADVLNPIVAAKEVVMNEKNTDKQNFTGSSLEDVDEQSRNIRSLISTIKDTSPELTESLKALNSIDINELNKLINNLSDITKIFRST